jgi:hypothetical protein
MSILKRAWLVAWGLTLATATLTAGSAPAFAGDDKDESSTSRTAASLKPLGKEAREALAAIPEDPEPEKLVDDYHFVVSNENRLSRFKNTLTDRGGILVGVGSEQNYLFAGWQKPEILILMDFDRVIADVHEVYRAFFLSAADPDALIAMWSPKAKERAEAAIASLCPEDKKEGALAAYTLARQLVHNRLRLLKAKYSTKRRPVATFLTDQDQYDYVVALFKTNRVRAMRGDFTGDQAMLGIAKASRAMGVPVRTLYLSNAEAYFRYTDNVRTNFIQQNIDDQSLVIRTAYTEKEKEFAYITQKTSDFQAWLELKTTRDLHNIMDGGFKRGPDETIVVGGPKN